MVGDCKPRRNSDRNHIEQSPLGGQGWVGKQGHMDCRDPRSFPGPEGAAAGLDKLMVSNMLHAQWPIWLERPWILQSMNLPTQPRKTHQLLPSSTHVMEVISVNLTI